LIIALSAGRDSPAELRARLALDEARQRELLRASLGSASEFALLCTCHRTEIYATADRPSSEAIHAVAALLPDLRASDHNDLRSMEGIEAVEHLFRVACGLDSLVIGEPQVLAQVRRAYVTAREEGAAGPVLSNIFGRAIRLGRQVRAETTLGRLGQSVGTIAADYLAARLKGLAGRIGAIVGAGTAAGDAARSITKAGARLSVISRTPASAARLAGKIGAIAYPLEELTDVFEASDFAVVAVSGGLLVRPSQLPSRKPEEPFLVLDLSVPSAVEVDGRDDVDIRTLEELPGPRGPEVAAAVVDAETLVRNELEELGRWIDTRASGPAIRELRSRAEKLVREEIARGLAGMDLSREQRDRIAALGVRIANKLIHGPTTALRDADEPTRSLIQRIFGLDHRR
jgi:glutamyl-tRNA reductase